MKKITAILFSLLLGFSVTLMADDTDAEKNRIRNRETHGYERSNQVNKGQQGERLRERNRIRKEEKADAKRLRKQFRKELKQEKREAKQNRKLSK